MEKRTIELKPGFDPASIRNANPKRTEIDPENHGFDLLSIPWLRKILLLKHTRSLFQVLLLILSLAIIYDGFWGEQSGTKNVATTLTWVDYRAVLIFSLLVLGGVFCMSCPFVLVSRQVQKRIGRNLYWPARLKNKWLAVAVMVIFIWFYEVFDMNASPFQTALVTVLYFAVAILVDAFFKGNSFCKYVCPLGLFTQAYAMVAPVEVKSKSFTYCHDKCFGKECVKGDKARDISGCQTFLYTGTKQSSMDCTYCMDCIRTCPHENVALQYVTPGHELSINLKRRDFSMGAAVLALTFSGLYYTAGKTVWFRDFEKDFTGSLGLNNRSFSLTLIIIFALVIIPAISGWLASRLTQVLAQTNEPLSSIFKRFAPGLLPVSFAIWVALYTTHFLTEGGRVWPAFGNMFYNLGLTGTSKPEEFSGNLIPPDWYGLLGPMQALVLAIGFFFSLKAITRISRRMFVPEVAGRAALGYSAFSLLIAVAGFLILIQPG